VAAGAAAGAGTVAYLHGELDATLGNNYDAVVRATDRTIAQMQFIKTGEKKDALSTEFMARTQENTKVDIIISPVDNLSRLQIRVGFWGNEMMSRTILDKIKANL
jgi:hypothetical protein